MATQEDVRRIALSHRYDSYATIHLSLAEDRLGVAGPGAPSGEGARDAEASIAPTTPEGGVSGLIPGHDRADSKKPPRRRLPSMRVVPIKTRRGGNLQ